MASKLGRVVPYLEALLPIKLHDPLIKCSFRSTLQTKSFISLLLQCPWSLNLAGWWLTMRAHINTVIWPFNHLVFWDQVIYSKHYISTTRASIATKLVRRVTYLDGLLPIKSDGPLITRKTIIFSLPVSVATKLDTLHKKMKFSIKDFFSKCAQIRRKLWIWSHLLKSLMENFIFYAVTGWWLTLRGSHL